MENSEENTPLENPVVNGSIKLMWFIKQIVCVDTDIFGSVERQAAGRSEQAAGRSEQAAGRVFTSLTCTFSAPIFMISDLPSGIICSLKY